MIDVYQAEKKSSARRISFGFFVQRFADEGDNLIHQMDAIVNWHSSELSEMYWYTYTYFIAISTSSASLPRLPAPLCCKDTKSLHFLEYLALTAGKSGTSFILSIIELHISLIITIL